MDAEQAQEVLSQALAFLDENRNTPHETKTIVFNSKMNRDRKNPGLNYDLYIMKSKSQIVIENMISIFEYLPKKVFHDTAEVLPYNPRNPKNTIDYLDLAKPGSDEEKINYLLNALNKSNVDYDYTKTERYATLKHSALYYQFKDKKVDKDLSRIILINNHLPILYLNKQNKSSGFFYNFDEHGMMVSIKYPVFKQPIHPHVLIIDDHCFLLSETSEKVFGFDDYLKDTASRVFDELLGRYIVLEESEAKVIRKKVTTKSFAIELCELEPLLQEVFDLNPFKERLMECGFEYDGDKIKLTTNNFNEFVGVIAEKMTILLNEEGIKFLAEEESLRRIPFN